MQDLLIHIGYHKTGTTWLQDVLFAAGSTTFFPLSETNDRQSTLARHFVMDDERYLRSPFDVDDTAVQQHMARLARRIEPHGDKCLVMSSERLSGSPFGGGFDAHSVARRLHVAFPEARVLIVIREQVSFVVSSYFQYLVEGGTKPIGEFLQGKYDGSLPSFSPHHIAYDRLIQHYQELFGKDRVLVLEYETFAADISAFIGRLARFIDRAIPFEAQLAATRRNVGQNHFWLYHLRLAGYLRSSNSLNNYSGTNNRYSHHGTRLALDVLRRVTPARLHARTRRNVESVVRDWAADRYVESNRRTRELTGLELASYA